MLCEVQSDKATVEITSPFDGVVKALMVKEGEVAQVGSGLCQIETEDDSPESEQSSAPEPAADPTPSEPTPAAAPPQEPQQAVETSSKSAAGLHPLAPGYVPNPKEKDVLCTPSVRHFARSQGVDLANLVPGSGKAGRIERKDVDAYLAGKATSSQPSQTSSTLAPVSVSADDALVQLGRTRYGMWKAMTKVSKLTGWIRQLQLTRIIFAELGDTPLWVSNEHYLVSDHHAHDYLVTPRLSTLPLCMRYFPYSTPIYPHNIFLRHSAKHLPPSYPPRLFIQLPHSLPSTQELNSAV